MSDAVLARGVAPDSGLSGTPRSDQTVIHGDCLAIMASMQADSVDIVVTSPPYNLALRYAAYDDKKADLDYVDWIFAACACIERVLKPDGSLFLNLSGSSAKPGLPFDILVRLRALFQLQNHITWVKSIAIGANSSGHYKPVPGRRFLHHTHEHIFHLTKSGAVPLDRLAIGIPFKDKSNIARRGHARDLRCRGNSWFIPYRTVRSKAQKFNHPGTFPIELPLWCIYLTGLRSPVVLDPFAGAGATLVAADRAGARGIGIDIDPLYAGIMRERMTQERANNRRVVLNGEEMDILLGSPTDGPDRLRSLLASLQDRLNKTTGQLTLTDEDMEQLRRMVVPQDEELFVHPLAGVFRRHLDIIA